MPTATKTKLPNAGSKRKAEVAKEISVKGLKKTKIDHSRAKAVAPKIGMPASKGVKEPIEQDSSDDGFDGFDDDGGVDLDHNDTDTPNITPEQDQFHGVHPDRVKAAGNGAGPNGTSSKEAHAKQKQLIAERKAGKPLADQLARTKKLWERLRRKSHVPLEERKKLIEELFEIITGKVRDFVLKHDSVRVIQTAIKYANTEQRKMIARELQGTYRQLAESKYAKFLIGKLLVQGDNEIRDIIVPEFFGHVRKVIKHPEASWILDDIYRGIATNQQKAVILREWYGAEFALFQKDKELVSGDLTHILAEDPGKRAPIMRSLQELINHLIQKKLTGFTLLHDAMLQYFLSCKVGTEEITDYIELIKGDEEGDLLKNLAFTKSGARVVCLALAYGTAKDRKHILRAYKDTLQLMAGDQNAHIVILTAYEVIDDTVLTSKSIFPELLGKDAEKQIENTVYFVNNLIPRTTLLYLLQGRSNALFPASLSSDLASLAETDGIRISTSKKDSEVRRKELVKTLSPYLLNAITSAADQFVITFFGCQFVTEVLFGAEGDKLSALKAVAKTAGGDPNPTAPGLPEPGIENAINKHESAETHQHLSLTAWGGKMVKSLVAGGHYDTKSKKVTPVSPPLNFADILYPVINDYIITWATGPSSFVVLSLLEVENFDSKSRKELVKLLLRQKRALQTAAIEETAEQKEAAQVRENQEKAGSNSTKAGKKAKQEKERTVGNTGTKLILKILDE